MTQVTEQPQAPAVRRGKYPCVVRARVSVETRERLDEAASYAGVSIGRFIRYRLSGIHVPDRGKLLLVNELRRQGGLLKHLASQGQDTGPVLSEIMCTLKIIQGA